MSKRAYQLVMYLTSEKKGRFSTIQDRSGKGLTEEQEILSRRTEFCSELYNHESCGDNAVLDCSYPPEEDLQSILSFWKGDCSSITEKGEVYQS